MVKVIAVAYYALQLVAVFMSVQLMMAIFIAIQVWRRLKSKVFDNNKISHIGSLRPDIRPIDGVQCGFLLPD